MNKGYMLPLVVLTCFVLAGMAGANPIILPTESFDQVRLDVLGPQIDDVEQFYQLYKMSVVAEAENTFTAYIGGVPYITELVWLQGKLFQKMEGHEDSWIEEYMATELMYPEGTFFQIVLMGQAAMRRPDELRFIYEDSTGLRLAPAGIDVLQYNQAMTEMILVVYWPLDREELPQIDWFQLSIRHESQRDQVVLRWEFPR